MKFRVGSTVGEDLKDSSNSPPESWTWSTRQWGDCDLRERKQTVISSMSPKWTFTRPDELQAWLQWGCSYRVTTYKHSRMSSSSFYLFNDGWWASPGTQKWSASFKYLWYIGSRKNRPLQEEVHCHLARGCGLGKSSAWPTRSPRTSLRIAKVYFQLDHQCLTFYS